MSDLISVGRAKQAIANHDSVDDRRVALLITAASAAIETYCNRTFASANYTEILDVKTKARIFTEHMPITAITRISVGRDTAIKIQNTDKTTNQRATAATTSTAISLTRSASGTTTTDTSVTWSANTTIGAVKTAIDALANGWSATVREGYTNWASADLFEMQGPFDALTGNGAELEVYAEDVTNYRTDDEAGEIIGRFPIGRRQLRIEYTAGPTSVAADIQEACAQLVAWYLHRNNRDTSLWSENIGDHSYSIYASDFPPTVKTLLTPHKMFRV